MLRKMSLTVLLLAMITLSWAQIAVAENDFSITTGVDLYNRYVWRGMDFGNAPSLQPTFAVGYAGFELGAWGAYTMSNEASDNDEIDLWVSYTLDLNNGASVTALVTDYTFPNSGIKFFNFNDYDAVIDDTIPDPGAHTIEVGGIFTGPESFPISLSGFINVYNDGGNNTYFQVDYPLTVNETSLNFFVGATGGSEDNPDYYGTDDLQVINIGVNASKDIKVTDNFSLPLSVSFIINPNAEMHYLLVGMSF
ncbi:MAG TPA: hypothetical protein PLF13_00350 [candidate division Zixibacteria bacterium]|nr:hypothetical protein [candidate division Zixibacteria bacterium]